MEYKQFKNKHPAEVRSEAECDRTTPLYRDVNSWCKKELLYYQTIH